MYEIEARTLELQPTAVVRGTITLGEIAAWLGDAYGAVMGYLGGHGIQPAGMPFARYRHLDDRFEVEAGFPVARPVLGEGQVEGSTLPGGPAAATWHIGPYEQLAEAYAALDRWIADKGGTPAGLAWEVYYSDPETEPDPSTWRTEVIEAYRPA